MYPKPPICCKLRNLLDILLSNKDKGQLKLRQKTNNELFALYEGEMVFYNHSARRIREAKRILKQFQNFLEEYPPTPELVKYFLATFSNCKTSTLARYADILNAFLKWFEDQLDLITAVPKRSASYFEEEDIEKILRALRAKKSHRNTIIRDVLLIDLAIHTRLTRSELASLTVDNIDIDKKVLVVRRSKGSKNKVIPISDNMSCIIAEYVRSKDKEDSLFGLAPAIIRGKIRTFAKIAGTKLKTYSPRDYFEISRKVALGYSNVPDKYVCAECFDDYAIKNFINKNTVENKCSYCDNKSKKTVAAKLENVMDFICQGINAEWHEPTSYSDNEIIEDAYLKIVNSDELIRWEIEELQNTNEEVLDDIVSSMIDRRWCNREPYTLKKEEALSMSWNEFSDQVKHHTRYIFLQLQEKDALIKMDLGMIPVSKMLGRLINEISEMEYYFGTVRYLYAGSIIFRARIHKKRIKLSKAKELSAAPLESAVYSNRMSPAGIPMFYGAFDPNTALKEILDTNKSNTEKVASIAKFRTLENLLVLDWSNLPEVPSIFDMGKSHLRSTLIFMKEFVDELSRPVVKDRMENIEYVPTQIFTEYIRHQYADKEGNPIEGIVYPSSRNPDGICCVLFMYNEQCLDDYQDPNERIVLPYVPNRRLLYLEDIKRRNIGSKHMA